MARGSAHGRGRRRHRALEQQLFGARRPARGRRGGKRGLDKYGAGTASVRFICGTFDIHRVLEERIARVFGNAGRALVRLLLEREHRALPDDLRRGLGDRLRRAQSCLDHRRRAGWRLKARRERFKHSDMARARREAGRRCRLLSDRHRHRRRLLDGRRSREAARDRRAARSVRRDQRRRRLARHRRHGRDRPRHDRALRVDRADRHHYRNAWQGAGRRGGRLRRRAASA